MMRDEEYIIGVCNRVLGLKAQRGKRFPFLLGDSSAKTGRRATLPVDAYYPELNLVIEYHELQHSEPVPFFDCKTTMSGPRSLQRRIYDDRRRAVLPERGINLVVLDVSMFDHKHNTKTRRLLRTAADEGIVRSKLAAFLPQQGDQS